MSKMGSWGKLHQPFSFFFVRRVKSRLFSHVINGLPGLYLLSRFNKALKILKK